MRSRVIILVPVGDLDKSSLEGLGLSLENIFGQKTQIAGKIQLPKEGWHRDQWQYLTSSILAVLSPPPSSVDRVLGVVQFEICYCSVVTTSVALSM